MGKPSWEKKLAEREKETRELIRKQGEREAFQRDVNFLAGDYLGLEDGRPGIGITPVIGESITTMPLHWLIISTVVSVALLLLLSLGVRACVGEERAEEILNESKAESARTVAGYPVNSAT